tara:strand:- start:268 stop:522 length:255 start_codon:yes stop_codon:yes gene_type:complete
MTKKELRELIKNILKEYTGTGAFRSPVKGGQNPRQSQRPFTSDEKEINFYNKQNNGEGGQGMQTRGMEKLQSIGNPNRSRFTRY